MLRSKLLLSFLLLLGLCAQASAITCFWVGGTANWDGTNTGGGGSGGIKWASATGGSTTCAGGGTGGSPGTGDNATFDASSGGGTATVTTTIAVSQLTSSAYTGTLDFNNNNINIGVTTPASTGWTDTGTGTHTVNMGSGTITVDATGTMINLSGANLTLNQQTSTVTAPARVASRSFQNAKTLNIVTLPGIGGATYAMNSAGTYGTLTLGAPASFTFAGTVTYTITTLSISGSSFSSATVLRSTAATQAILAVTNAVSAQWGVFENLNFSSGALTATNSIDMGNNTGATITGPSAGGGSGGKIIGG